MIGLFIGLAIIVCVALLVAFVLLPPNPAPYTRDPDPNCDCPCCNMPEDHQESHPGDPGPWGNS
jgi:hypothetical protein